MRRLIRWTIPLVLATGLCPGRLAAETVESVEQKIIEQMRKLDSWSARARTVSEAQDTGFKHRSVTEGTYETRMNGDAVMFRLETTTTTVQEIGGKPRTTITRGLTVCDGQHVYALSETEGQKTVVKNKARPRQESEGFREIRGDYDLSLLPNEKLDGKEVHVIRATPKRDTRWATVSGPVVYYYDCQTGILLKSVTYGPDGKPRITTTYADIKLNPSIPAERFAFTPPANAVIIDKSVRPEAIAGE